LCPKASNKRFKSEKNLTLHLHQFPECKPFSVLRTKNVSTSSGSTAGEFLAPIETTVESTSSLKYTGILRRDFLNPYDPFAGKMFENSLLLSNVATHVAPNECSTPIQGNDLPDNASASARL
jgi:hypothetical protein